MLTPDAVNLRLQKASLTVRHVLRSPDILGVVEVENLSILQRLAARINADAVAQGEDDPMYVAYLEEGNDIGGIDSGFLVKSSRVDVLSVEQVGKDATYTPPGQSPGAPLPLLNDRPPLVLQAAVHGPIATPFPVTVIVNHLRSLSGIDGADGDRIRAKRRAQAEFLASLIQSRQATERVISVGDYNAFAFNDGFVDSRRHDQGDADTCRSGCPCERRPRRSGSDESRRLPRPVAGSTRSCSTATHRLWITSS